MRGHLTPALGQSPSLGPCSVPALESPRASLKGARPRQLPALGTPPRASEGESIGRVPAWVILLPGASAVSGAVCGRYSSGRGGAPGIARIQPRGAAERPRTHRTAHSRELPSRQLCWAWGPGLGRAAPAPASDEARCPSLSAVLWVGKRRAHWRQRWTKGPSGAATSSSAETAACPPPRSLSPLLPPAVGGLSHL